MFFILEKFQKQILNKKRGDNYLLNYFKIKQILLICVMLLYEISLIQINSSTNFSKYSRKISVCEKTERIQFTNENWTLEIPKIELKANINFGTTEEVLNKFIGHFDVTEVWTGNIGLAAHNRGYPVNYFGRIKELQIGDEIKYTTLYGVRSYKVVISTIIEDTDWSYLQETEENTLTLITCVENQPNYRRCIQAIESI